MKGVLAPSLLELQKWMRWIITDPRGVGPALSDVPPSDIPYRNRYLAPTKNCFEFIVDAPPIPKSARIDIYAEAYFSRLLESFAADFETILKILEEDAFSKLTADYLKAHPSSKPNIGEVGSHLEAFLATHEFSEELPFLPELAKLEWTVIQSFYADDMPILAMESLGEVKPEEWPEAKFVLDASVFFLELDWPVDELWNSKSDENFGEKMNDFQARLSHLLVFRRNGYVAVESLDRIPFQMLKWMKAGQSLNEMCENLGAITSEVPPLMNWFQEWVGSGVIRKIGVGENNHE